MQPQSLVHVPGVQVPRRVGRTVKTPTGVPAADTVRYSTTERQETGLNTGVVLPGMGVILKHYSQKTQQLASDI
jgi:hypothetical protein